MKKNSFRNGNALAILYFLKNTITDSVDNIGEKKEFITASQVVSAYTSDNVRTPGNAVTSSAALTPFGISSITRYQADPHVWNWFLDNVEGNVFIGICMSAIFASAMALVMVVFKRFGVTAAK